MVATMTTPKPRSSKLDGLFRPRSVAIIRASRRKAHEFSRRHVTSPMGAWGNA